jgi:iron complex outermembrane recepter protein
MSDSSKSADKKVGKPGAIALTTASALLSFATSAAAQDSTPTDAMPDGAESIEEVVVTGFRASLDKALDAKQAQVGAIDMIVAEDIADFPDLNLAESLQRVPGVVITRDAGEGRQISVRGLGPQFTRVRINGIEAMSANGGTDAQGGTNRNRNFDFNTFASELFNNLTVRKTSAAENEEGSLGATVELQTGRPFDFDGLTVAAGVQLGYNDLNEDTDPRATFLISNTFADGKFGALMSVAYSDRKLADDGSSTVRWQNGLGTGASFGANEIGSTAPPLATLNAAFRPRIPRFDKYEHDQQRLGVTASLQFAPSDSTSFNFDALYSQFDAEREEIFLESVVFSTATPATIGDVNTIAAEIDDTNTLVYGLFNDVDIRSEARHDELQTRFYQFTLEGEHRFSEAFSIDGRVGFAEANHDNPVQTTLLFDAPNVDGYSFDYRANSRVPLITYGTAAVESDSPQNVNGGIWALSQIRLRPQSTINSFQTAELDFVWKQSDAFTLKIGPQWKNYIFKTTEVRRTNGTTGNVEAILPAIASSAPIAGYSEITEFGDGLDMPAGSVTRWLSPDVDAAVDVLDLNNRTIYPLGITPALGNNAEVEEDDIGGYIQGDFRFEVGNQTLRGNLGVRYVETTQNSKGYANQGTTAGAPVLQEAEREYSDTLPSLNLVYDISDELLLRFGAAKVMTRPNLGNITPSAAVTGSSTVRTVTVGNPLLEPFRAEAYDLGVEWYFAPESLLSLALFYKDIGTFVQNQRTTAPFTGNPFGIPDSVAIAACGNQAGCNPAADWQFTFPVNTPGGDLQGFEISYQQPFTFLPGVWSNFGTLLNYTGVESEIEYLVIGAPSVTNDLTGLSEDAYNATLYFDNKVFSARVSGAFRSDYLTTVPGRDNNDVEGTAETLNIDFSASYHVNDNFTVSLEGLNLTDEVQDQWVSSTGDRLSYYHHQGRQFYVGARFKY